MYTCNIFRSLFATRTPGSMRSSAASSAATSAASSVTSGATSSAASSAPAVDMAKQEELAKLKDRMKTAALEKAAQAATAADAAPQRSPPQVSFGDEPEEGAEEEAWTPGSQMGSGRRKATGRAAASK